jgi:putative ABC transport system permease protein
MRATTKKAAPPRFARKFLEWYCKPQLLEDLEGDLLEYFDRNVRSHGAFRAKLIYIIDVIKFLRPYTVRKPEFINLLINWIMIGSYVKTSTRNISRNTLFSSINIIGLAISMSVGLLMIAFLADLMSYDSFHVNRDRIYRVNTNNQFLDHPSMDLASTSVRAGRRIDETISGIDKLTVMRRGFAGDAINGEKITPTSGLWADPSVFDVFSFDFLQGSSVTALKEPFSIVLTEKTSRKIFGDEPSLGKSLRFDTAEYVVTGVIKDIPKFSHLRFEALVSFSTIELSNPDFDGDFYGWSSIYSNYVYFTLSPGVAPETIRTGLDKLCAVENKGLENQRITLWLQPLSSIAIGTNLSNPIGPHLHIAVVWIMGGLAFVVIMSACFNYTNLSIARSLRRSREVGIRKVIGALKSQVMVQFIAESVLIAMMALVLALALFMFLRIQFLGLNPFIEEMVSLELSLRLVLYFILFALAVGIVAGFLPAYFFSRINASQVLKNTTTLKVFRNINLRKSLLVIQYTFSLMFISATIVGFNQYKSFLSFDLGFQTSNILNVRMQGNKDELFIKELSEIPGVSGISRSRIVTSVGSMYGTHVKHKNPSDSVLTWLNFVDENYLPIHKHKFVAGQNLKPPAGGNESEVIVNEQLLKHFGIGGDDPQKALGEALTVEGKELTIVGVLRDFHYGTVESKIEPVIFRYSSSERQGYINAKISTTDIAEVMSAIEKAWKKIDNIHPLDAMFYDEQIQRNYSQFSVMVKVIGFLAFLAICISSMGLFGMVVFTTETRLKEISIRKVFGASEGGLVVLLSRSFIMLLGISAFIALPSTYFLFTKVVLVNFVYHKPVTFWEITVGLLVVAVLAFIMIGSQTLKVARSNPAVVLKNE